MSAVEDRLAELGLSVPEVARPVASYVPAVRSGSQVFTSGQLPMRAGQLMATGKVGGEVSPDDAVGLAQQCALNAIAAVKAEIGDLDAVTRVVKVVCFIASTPDFTGQPQVANGASELLGTGKVGGEVTPEEAVTYAQQCALNAIAAVKAEIGDLDQVKRVVKVVCFVASVPEFSGQPQVANGASDLLGKAFGDAGVHARSAVGVPVLPLDAPVEVEILVEV